MTSTMPAWLTDLQVAERRCQSRPQVWRLVRAGLLTPPVKLSAGCSRWPGDEVLAIDRARLAGADDDAVRGLVRQLVAARSDAKAAA